MRPRPALPNAPRPTITVTQDNIDTAIRADSGHCMVADALRDSYPHIQRIQVDLRTIRFTDPDKKERYTYLTPLTVATKIAQWDQGIPPTPFSIRLSSAIQVRPTGRDGDRQRRVTGVRRNGRRVPTVHGGTATPRGALAAGATPRTTARARRPNPDRATNGRQFGVRALNLDGGTTP